jgi:hypothetical protein
VIDRKKGGGKKASFLFPKVSGRKTFSGVE